MNPQDFLARNTRLSAYCIAVVTLFVYLPTLGNGWVNWDDDQYVINNHVMTAPDGLWRIWCTWETKDYYPLTFTLLYIPVCITL
jgi:hypothetical protein